MIDRFNNKKILKTILISLLTIILGIGVSYAFYAAIINGNETTTTLQLEAGVLSIKYDGGDIIEAEGFLPGSEAFATKTFTLTGNNDSELNMPYNLSLIIDENTFNERSLNYKLSGINTSNNGDILLDGNKTISGESMNLGKGYFAPGATNAVHTFVIKFYYPDDGTDQSDEMNASFKAHIKVEGTKIMNSAFDVLISQSTSNSASSPAFNGPINRVDVEKIIFKDNIKIDDGSIASWDVSVSGSGKIIAYTLDEDNNGLYELYIGQDGGVIANSDGKYLFANYTSLKEMNLTYLNTYKITDMSWMFSSNAATNIIGLNSFDTSSVTNMYAMFASNKATSLDLSNFDTSNVTNMSYMFTGSAATDVNLSNFNTSKVNTIASMFYQSKATSLELDNFDTGNVTDMSYMFASSSAMTITGLNSFNTSKVTNMYLMFGLVKASNLDLSSFDTSNVTNMGYMFTGCTTPVLDLSSFDTSKVTNMDGMFSSSTSTTGYARNQDEADKFNASSNKPSGLTFVVKS